MSTVEKNSPNKRQKKNFYSAIIILLGILVFLTFIFGYKFKGLIVVAMVNGKPIYSWQFINYFWRQSGQITLQEMINKQLLEDEVKNTQTTVSEDELQKEIEKIKTNQGGQAELEKLLQNQNLNYQEFQERVKIQLMIDKILEKQISITDREVEAFITLYSMQLQATDEAGKKAEAKELLKSQKISQGYQSFFTQLKEKAKIDQFLKFP